MRDVGADQRAGVVDRRTVTRVDPSRLVLEQAPERLEIERHVAAGGRVDRDRPAVHEQVAAEEDAGAELEEREVVRRVPRRVQYPERAVAGRDRLAVYERGPGDVVRCVRRMRELREGRAGPALREDLDAFDVIAMEMRDEDLREPGARLLRVEDRRHALDERVR